jgi:hypothetical protein
MEKVFTGSQKIILDDQAGKRVLPYLPLEKMQRNPKPSGGGVKK